MTETELAAVIRGIAPIVREQIATAVADARLALTLSYEQALGELRDRVLVAETKAAVPVPTDPAIAALEQRLAALDTRTDAALAVVRLELGQVDAYATRLEGYTSFLQRDAAALSERVAVVETRAQVPGPAGQDGTAGADGLGFDDLDVKFDGYNMLTFEFTRAGLVKGFPVSLPFLRYQGVYQHSQKYFHGDVVTWAGSTWHCSEPTTAKPDEGSKVWTLMVKRGRDGKDGVDAPGALPVVSLGKKS